MAFDFGATFIMVCHVPIWALHAQPLVLEFSHANHLASRQLSYLNRNITPFQKRGFLWPCKLAQRRRS